MATEFKESRGNIIKVRDRSPAGPLIFTRDLIMANNSRPRVRSTEATDIHWTATDKNLDSMLGARLDRGSSVSPGKRDGERGGRLEESRRKEGILCLRAGHPVVGQSIIAAG